MASHPGNDRAPSLYAGDYLATLVVRWNGALGDSVRSLSANVWPGVPPEAFVGFTTIGGQADDTGLPPVNNSFHEIGYFQTEAGPRDGPSPNPDPSAADNSWGRLANDPAVVAMLGRPATMAPDGWRSAVDDQVAVGLVNLARDAAAVSSGIDPSAAPRDPSSLWNVALGFSGFSAGVGGTRSSVGRYAGAIASAPERLRFGAWIQAILADATAGTLPGGAGSHGNPAYDALRVWQKLAAGQALAQATGGDVGWFDIGFGVGTPDEAAAQRALTDAAYGRSVGGVPSLEAASGLRILLEAVVVAAVAGGAAWYWMRQR